jgi:fatty-acyl-CoA synthase
VELVPLHTLPRTSSGKLSRSRARLNYIESQKDKMSVVARQTSPQPMKNCATV